MFLVSTETLYCLYLLYIISQLSQGRPQLHHVLRGGVEVLEGTEDVTGSLLNVQGIIQNDLVTRNDSMKFSRPNPIRQSIY